MSTGTLTPLHSSRGRGVRHDASVARGLWGHCSKDRGLRQPGDLTRENNPAIALDYGGGRDGSRVCPGDFESVTVSGSGLEFMAMGSRSVVFAVGVCSASGTGVREREQL